MQRLYSTFARGCPGMGLVWLRLTAALAAFHYAAAGLAAGQPLFAAVIEGIAGVLLCAGLWTPVAGALLAAVLVWSLFSANGDPWSQILLATMGVALALLGPGAWSIDARVFGRKRLVL